MTEKQEGYRWAAQSGDGDRATIEIHGKSPTIEFARMAANAATQTGRAQTGFRGVVYCSISQRSIYKAPPNAVFDQCIESWLG